MEFCKKNSLAARCLAAALLLCGLTVSAAQAASGKPVEIKLVTLAPLGTSPHVALLKMGEAWRKASGGKVKLTVIGSYRAGGEAAIVDKMGVGGVDAALMTIVGLAKISPAINALATIPMVYNSLDEVDYVTEKLGTGMINEVSATPFSANAGQYATVAKHMLAINWAPLVGGLVMRRQAWERVPPEIRHNLLTIAGQTGRDAKAAGRKESEEAVEAMKKKQNLKVYLPSAQVNEEWRKVARSFYPRIRGTIVPADMFDKVEASVREYRGRQFGSK